MGPLGNVEEDKRSSLRREAHNTWEKKINTVGAIEYASDDGLRGIQQGWRMNRKLITSEKKDEHQEDPVVTSSTVCASTLVLSFGNIGPGLTEPLARAAPGGRERIGLAGPSFLSTESVTLLALLTVANEVIGLVAAGAVLALLARFLGAAGFAAGLRPPLADAESLLSELLSKLLILLPLLAGLAIFRWVSFLGTGCSSWEEEGVIKPVSLRGRFLGVEVMTTATFCSESDESSSSELGLIPKTGSGNGMS